MSNLPTLYEYYIGSGIKSGLSDDNPYFTLNNKKITLLSGTVHYFRVHPAYWRDRLRKVRAAGLNAVETYVPWNVHEPQPGIYDFGWGGTDFQDFLDIETFIKTAQEEDLFVIVRPGPYICAEWEFGGMPSWLLREKDMKIRTSDTDFVKYVANYFSVLLEILSKLQFTRGGPIIAFQIENEYGNTKKGDEPVDTKYLEMLKDLMKNNGIVELLFTSDTPSNGNWGSLPGILNTANFQENPEDELRILQGYQPGKPLMVMEYWTGWFDHWTEKHHSRTNEAFSDVYEKILRFPSSVNMYMFHGGSNWGFLNGGNLKDSSTDNGGYQSDTSSYDYDAPLTENGDYTGKYHSVKELNEKYNEVKTKTPNMPPVIPRTTYEEVIITDQMNLETIITNAEHHINTHKIVPMELIPINNGAGQSYGYVVYRKRNINIPSNSVLKIEGRVCDTALVLINGQLKSKMLNSEADLNDFGYWKVKNGSLNLGHENYDRANLDIVVENWGRINYGKLDQFRQYKGLWQGNVSINGEIIYDWEIVPLEFKKNWTKNLKAWTIPNFQSGPALYRGVIKLSNNKSDTFIDMRKWNKGIVIINGFVLSRYLKLGPQQTIYLPAPFLKEGENEIIIFEHFKANSKVEFSLNPIYQTLP